MAENWKTDMNWQFRFTAIVTHGLAGNMADSAN